MAVDNSALLGGFLYAAIPGAALLVGGALVLTMTLNRNVQAAVQNLAAGIILAAVADQLVPLMKNHNGDAALNTVGMTIGFVAALTLMYTVDKFCGHHGEDAEVAAIASGVERQSLVKRDDSFGSPYASPTGDLRRLSYSRISLPTTVTAAGSWSSLPWALVVGVTVNTCVDGFLIGLTYPASQRAALIVSIATTVEHLFLGVTYMVTLREITTWRKIVPVIVTPAVLMMCCGLVGAIFSSLAEDSPAVFTALMSFGTIALLFLITHELLMEAYDNQAGKQNFVCTIWVFLGFFAVLAVEHLLPTSTK